MAVTEEDALCCRTTVRHVALTLRVKPVAAVALHRKTSLRPVAPMWVAQVVVVVVALHRKTSLRPGAPSLGAKVVVASYSKTSLRHVARTAASLHLSLARAQ